MTTMTNMTVTMTVNGAPTSASVPARKLLTDFLRDDLELTGTKLGCEHGVCGACTVLLNGEAVRSCLLFTVQADGADVMTVEGLAGEDGLHPLQEAFRNNHALQCGFCTPGFLMSVYAFLAEGNRDPTDEEVRVSLAGNICRCTGYQGLVAAVKEAAASGGG
jgi:carbon-monoxide dehydrogenase small subunit